MELGEHRWLGLTLSPTVAALFREHQAAKPPSTGDAAGAGSSEQGGEGGLKVSTSDMMFSTEGMRKKSADARKVKEREAAALESVRELLSPFLMAAGEEASLAVGPAMQGVEAFEVEAEDSRTGLRGQLGLRATRDFAPMECFGVYGSYVMTEAEYNKFLTENLQRKGDIEAYTVDMNESWQPLKLDRSGAVVKNGTSIKLVFMGHGYGNKTALMIDPQREPIALFKAHGKDRVEQYAAEDLVGEPNAIVAMFWVGGRGGFPVPVAMTRKEGKAGQELLYCYGADYWDTYIRGTEEAARFRSTVERNRQLELDLAQLRKLQRSAAGGLVAEVL